MLELADLGSGILVYFQGSSQTPRICMLIPYLHIRDVHIASASSRKHQAASVAMDSALLISTASGVGGNATLSVSACQRNIRIERCLFVVGRFGGGGTRFRNDFDQGR